MNDQIIGFTCGAFDLCHYGHVLMFEECKRHCTHLIVGVQTDPSIDRPEKNRPIQSLEERLGQIRALRFVDQTIVYETESQLYDFLKTSQIDIRFLGSDWKGKEYTGYDLKLPTHFCVRDHTYSSSELRSRIFLAEKLKLLLA